MIYKWSPANIEPRCCDHCWHYCFSREQTKASDVAVAARPVVKHIKYMYRYMNFVSGETGIHTYFYSWHSEWIEAQSLTLLRYCHIINLICDIHQTFRSSKSTKTPDNIAILPIQPQIKSAWLLPVMLWLAIHKYTISVNCAISLVAMKQLWEIRVNGSLNIDGITTAKKM